MKSLLGRLFNLGSIPKEVRPVFEAEGILISDEGMAGRLICRDVTGKGKRAVKSSEGFTGCLVITRKRIACYTYRKRQINISVDDPKIKEISVDVPKDGVLSISFESSDFREGWKGRMEFRFNTDKAREFMDILHKMGNRQS